MYLQQVMVYFNFIQCSVSKRRVKISEQSEPHSVKRTAKKYKVFPASWTVPKKTDSEKKHLLL